MPASICRLYYFFFTFSTSQKPLVDFDETCQDARAPCTLPSLCFSGRSKNQDSNRLWSADKFSTFSLWNCWTKLDATCQEARNQLKVLYNVCGFFAPICKLRWPPLPLIDWNILTSSLKPLNGIKQNLIRSEIAIFFTKFVFSGRSEN